MSLASLPPEIFSYVALSLAVPDFISLVSTCKPLYSLKNDSIFWRTKVREDFRIPPQPLLEEDGKRWQWVYKSLKLRSTVYTWGNDKHGNLGRDFISTRNNPGWPGAISGLQEVGNVADVQCGGWSTVLLSTKGSLFAAGVVNGLRNVWPSRREKDTSLIPIAMPMRPDPRWVFDLSSRSISEFSMGRARLLALSDQGEVIEWNLNFTVAGEILSLDTQRSDFAGRKEPIPDLIVAGWGHSSAYYPLKGLHYWTIIGELPDDQKGSVNRILSKSGDVQIVPGTTQSHDEGVQCIGLIKKYLVLDKHIIMLTTKGRLFSWRTHTDGESATEISSDLENCFPTEMTTFYSSSFDPGVIDIQGSFAKFAVFGQDGTIKLCSIHDDAIDNTLKLDGGSFRGQEPTMPKPTIIPALQRANIVQLAFGDHHFHALHASGEVTSYGMDSDLCGALGFGRGFLSAVRGVLDVDGSSHPNQALCHPSSDGHRTIWFEPEKQLFATAMHDKLLAEDRLSVLIESAPDRFREVCGEWFEQEGRNWSTGPSRSTTRTQVGDSKGKLPPYFVLKIAAAGWSSAAVILVDDPKADKIRRKYLLPDLEGEGDSPENYIWNNQSFPRLKLP